MKLRLALVLTVLMIPALSTAAPTNLSKIDVCRVAANPTVWIGKQLRVEGFIIDLSSHGVVMASSRKCKTRGQVQLYVQSVFRTTAWNNVFTATAGPRKAVLIGTLTWQGGGRSPALEVSRVESISASDAHWDELS